MRFLARIMASYPSDMGKDIIGRARSLPSSFFLTRSVKRTMADPCASMSRKMITVVDELNRKEPVVLSPILYKIVVVSLFNYGAVI